MDGKRFCLFCTPTKVGTVYQNTKFLVKRFQNRLSLFCPDLKLSYQVFGNVVAVGLPLQRHQITLPIIQD